MFKRLFAMALVFGATALAPPVAAQSLQCLPRAALVETLQSKYGETLEGRGLQSPRLLLEIWRSGKSGSFTVFLTRPDGMSCILATGQNWFSEKPVSAEGITS